MSESIGNTDGSHKRAWFALLLTIFVPGLGHAYLELWKRAFLWLGLYLLSTAVFVPDSASPESLSVDAFVEASQSIPLHVAGLIVGISLLCLIDAYLMTMEINTRANRSVDGTRVCPHCGKEVDDDLDFCHWCTTRLDEPDGSQEP